MSRGRRILASMLVVAATALVVGGVTFAAFSRTTNNPSNSFAAGTVQIGDNDSGSAMFTIASLAPNDTRTRCIRVTRSGSLTAGVKLYGSAGGALAPYLNLVVTRGDDSAPTFPSCNGFSPDSSNYIGAGPGVLYSGPLNGYPASWAAGIVDPTAGWTGGEAHSYRFALTLSSDPAGQGQSATASFSWEARNQ